jgi:hypothetical protein
MVFEREHYCGQACFFVACVVFFVDFGKANFCIFKVYGSLFSLLACVTRLVLPFGFSRTLEGLPVKL